MVVPVMFSKYVDNMWMITIIIAFATAAHQGWGANLMTTVGDQLPNNYVSSVIGFGGMLGSAAGIIFPLLSELFSMPLKNQEISTEAIILYFHSRNILCYSLGIN